MCSGAATTAVSAGAGGSTTGAGSGGASTTLAVSTVSPSGGNCLNRHRVQVFHLRCIQRGRGRQDGLIGQLGQLDGSRLFVDKMFAVLVAGVEPCLQSRWLSCRRFGEGHDYLVVHLQPEVRNCENGGKQLGFVLAEDLDEVTV